jgi:hypothetical protein
MSKRQTGKLSNLIVKEGGGHGNGGYHWLQTWTQLYGEGGRKLFSEWYFADTDYR